MIEKLGSIPEGPKYSAEVSAVLDRAQEIAKQSGKRFVGTGCLLLSIIEYSPELVDDPEQNAAKCRKVLRIDQSGLSAQQSISLDLPFSPDAAKALRAAEESGGSSKITVAQLLREVTLQGQTRTDAHMILKRTSLR